MPVDVPPHALMVEQPAIIVPPVPSELRANDEAWLALLAEEVKFGNEELAGSWQVFANSKNGSVWMIRAKDMSKTNDSVRKVWVKIDHRSDSVISSAYSLEFIQIDCDSKRIATLIDSIYEKNGDQAGHIFETEPNFVPTMPESPSRLLLHTVCGS